MAALRCAGCKSRGRPVTCCWQSLLGGRRGKVAVLLRALLQVFAMPIFDSAETLIRHSLQNPPRPLTLRLLFRSAYVAAVTFVACLLPFFGELMVSLPLEQQVPLE